MRLLLAANNQATRRNEIIKSYLQLGSSSNRYAPRLPQQETKSSTKQLPPTGPILGPENILKTGFAQKSLPSCPSGRHKPQSFIETKTLRFSNLDTKNFKKWTYRRSHFWDRMHCLVKEQKKSTFTVPFLGPSGSTKNETAKSQNQQQRPTRATNKTWQLRLVKQQASRVGTEEARTCEAWFQLTFRPQKWNLKAHMWHQLSPFPSSNAAIAMQHRPGNIHQSVATPATPLLRGMS